MITIQSVKEKINCFWWHHCKYYGNKKFQAIIKELFIRCRKLNISLAFITQSNFSVPKDVRLNSTHFIMKINNRRELQNIATDHSAHIDYKDLVKITENVQKNHIIFWQQILRYQQVILEDLEKMCLSLYKNDIN